MRWLLYFDLSCIIISIISILTVIRTLRKRESRRENDSSILANTKRILSLLRNKKV